MKKHNYEAPTEERFRQIMKLQEQLLYDEITEDEYASKVSSDDRANFRIMAQLKFNEPVVKESAATSNSLTRKTIKNAREGKGIGNPIENIRAFIDSL